MNILLVATEAAPFAKSGGLADVVSALAMEWKKKGHRPIIIIPKYKSIDVEKYGFKPTHLTLIVSMGYWTEYATLWKGCLPNSEAEIYLLENNTYFHRNGMYGELREYADNDRRFIFFSRAVLEAAKALNFKPDIIHANDYHTAYSLAFLKTHYRNERIFSRTAGVFTIHNLAYQGRFAPEATMEYASFGMENCYPGSWFEYYGGTNYMKTGIMFADKITTVSPTYAAEIRTEYFGEGLHNVLNERSSDLIGILNGVDYNAWNPQTDKLIYDNYTANTLENKKDIKYKLLHDNGIYDNLDLPLVGMISRMTEQKGFELVINKLETFLWEKRMRIVVIGSGERYYQDYFNYIKAKYPYLSIIYIGYNEMMSHAVYAASDFLMIPSRFEPCGLTQMYAMKYGALPVVRATGGLADTVHEFVPDYKTGNGFVFWNYNADEFAHALHRGLLLYDAPEMLDIARKNAMSEDFSSSKSADAYLEVFEWALEKVR